MASSQERRGLSALARRVLIAAYLAVAASTSISCQSAGSNDGWQLSLNVNPDAPYVDRPARIEATLLDGVGRSWSGATLQFEAHMEHPGMVPVIVPAVERAQGVYAGEVRFTMAGSWVVFATGQLADGRRIRSRMAAPVTVSAAGG